MVRNQPEKHQTYLKYILPLLLVLLGWFYVFNLAVQIETSVIETFQNAQLEIVRNAARAAQVYVSAELEHRGEVAIDDIEREVQRELVQPIRIGLDTEDAWMVGDAWIYAPDHLVFDQSEDVPEDYQGLSLGQMFALQVSRGAGSRHYDYMVNGVINLKEGVDWYVWEQDKGGEFAPWWEFLTQDTGIEVAAWTPVEVAGNAWTIGMSAVLTRLMSITGAYRQVQNAILQMLVVSVLALGLLYYLYTSQKQISALKQQVAVLQIQIDETQKQQHVDEIVETDYFQDLASKAAELRSKMKD